MRSEADEMASLGNEKHSVALTGYNTTGPPCSRVSIIRLEAALRHRLACARVKPFAGPPWSVTDDDRRRRQTQTTVTSLVPYTMCRRASNKEKRLTITE